MNELIQMPDEHGEYDKEIEVDTYLGVIVRKPNPRQWRLTVSFLQNIFTDQERLSCTRDLYRFEWQRDQGEALGTRRVIRSVGQLVAATHADVENALSFDYTERRSRSVERAVLFPGDCAELRNKIIAHADMCLGLVEGAA